MTGFVSEGKEADAIEERVTCEELCHWSPSGLYCALWTVVVSLGMTQFGLHTVQFTDAVELKFRSHAGIMPFYPSGASMQSVWVIQLMTWMPHGLYKDDVQWAAIELLFHSGGILGCLLGLLL